MAKLKKDGTPKRSGGARPNAGRKRNYNSYVTKVKIRIKKLEANGVDVSNIQPMTEKQFDTTYDAIKNEFKEEGKKGSIVDELIKETVDKKVFKLTPNHIKALKNHPEDLNYYELRTGAWLQKEIANAKQKSEDDGIDFNESKFVSTEFFGS